MLGYQIDEFGDIAGVNLHEMDAPGPLARGDVRVRIRACSVNRRDLLAIAGLYRPGGAQPGMIPLSDASGEVVETGESVWTVQVGDRIALTFNPEWVGGQWEMSPGVAGRGGVAPGVLCQEIVVDQREVVLLAPHLSFEEGATLPCAALTAWSALRAGRHLLPGQTVLVQGTGGVSIFALQLAQLFGARVIVISSSDEKIQLAKNLGAWCGINYQTHPDWDEKALDITDGGGVDRVIELGGKDTITRSLSAVRHQGSIAVVGALSGPPSGVATPINKKFAELNMIRVGSQQDFKEMMRAIDAHQLRPVIDQVFAFENAREAIRRLETRNHVGKIVVSIS